MCIQTNTMLCTERGMLGPELLLESINNPEYIWFLPRGVADYHDFGKQFKQLIPYVVVSSNDRIACYRRSKAAGEDRLHDKWSVGFGGHVNVWDSRGNDAINVESTIRRAMRRELYEELNLELEDINSMERHVLGFINDPSDDVGQVHLGVCELWDFPDLDLGKMNEAEGLIDGEFMELDLLPYDQLEGWSKIVIDHLRNQD